VHSSVVGEGGMGGYGAAGGASWEMSRRAKRANRDRAAWQSVDRPGTAKWIHSLPVIASVSNRPCLRISFPISRRTGAACSCANGQALRHQALPVFHVSRACLDALTACPYRVLLAVHSLCGLPAAWQATSASDASLCAHVTFSLEHP